MTIIVLPTNVRLPTLLDDARAAYLAGTLPLEDFEQTVEQLVREGTADDVAPRYGLLHMNMGYE